MAMGMIGLMAIVSLAASVRARSASAIFLSLAYIEVVIQIWYGTLAELYGWAVRIDRENSERLGHLTSILVLCAIIAWWWKRKRGRGAKSPEKEIKSNSGDQIRA
jgi:hypothetical protein